MDAITPPVKERPIIFSAAMVRAILEGRKTQTRRIIKPQPGEVAGIKVEHFHPAIIDRRGDLQPGPEIFGAYSDDGEWGAKCPYGQPGDRLWVRETWVHGIEYDQYGDRARGEDGEFLEKVWFRADGDLDAWRDEHDNLVNVPWKSSVHMPRWASRITLEIVSVRVERLQDMKLRDYNAEGFLTEPTSVEMAVVKWRELGDGLHGKDAHERNSWVWVIEFKRVDA